LTPSNSRVSLKRLNSTTFRGRATRDVDVAAAHVDAESLETEPAVVADRLDVVECDHVDDHPWSDRGGLVF